METPYKPLTPKQKKEIKNKIGSRTATQDEYLHLDWDRRFNNRRQRGVNRFRSQEKKRLMSGGQGTRNWTEQQTRDIINGKMPNYNGIPIEGHHKYNALDYPQMADDGNYIYPATYNVHFNRWHGGNWQNDTSGSPINPNYPEEF